MAIQKITFDGQTLIDLTGDTVNQSGLLNPLTAHDANGNIIAGTMPTVAVSSPTVSKTINGATATVTPAINQPLGYTPGENKTGTSTTVAIKQATAQCVLTGTVKNFTGQELTFTDMEHEPLFYITDLHSEFDMSTKDSNNTFVVAVMRSLTEVDGVAVTIAGTGGSARLQYTHPTSFSAQYTNNTFYINITSNGTYFYPGTFKLTYWYLE